MRPLAVLWVLAGLLSISRPAGAQGPPPRIPWWVVDIHASVPTFPDAPNLALSRALSQSELPGAGLGGDVGLHLYPFKWRAVTFGVGGRLMTARAHRDPDPGAAPTVPLRPVTERFTYMAPQISLNFGSGTGWSYLSGGISRSKWSVVPDGAMPLPPDEEHLKTLDYGGGARWFPKPHVAFSFDVRVYAISPSVPFGGLPAGPRTSLLVMGAGISLK